MCGNLRWSSSWCRKVRLFCVVGRKRHTFDLWFALGMDLRWNTAEHSFHLIHETLVYQSVSKRIDGGIDHNHHMRNGNCNWAELVRANVIHDMEYGMCTPGNTKYSTYDYHCQSDSLANLQHTLYTGDNYTVKFIRKVDLKTVRTWDIAS